MRKSPTESPNPPIVLYQNQLQAKPMPFFVELAKIAIIPEVERTNAVRNVNDCRFIPKF